MVALSGGQDGWLRVWDGRTGSSVAQQALKRCRQLAAFFAALVSNDPINVSRARGVEGAEDLQDSRWANVDYLTTDEAKQTFKSIFVHDARPSQSRFYNDRLCLLQ